MRIHRIASRCRFAILMVFGPAGAAVGAPLPFTEEAASRGVNYSAVYLPPMSVGHAGGSQGACFADLDLDGDADLILVGSADGRVGVFENDGTGHFTERLNTGMPTLEKASSATAADYDADGDLDVFLAQHAYPTTQSLPHHFMRNEGGFQFVNVTASAQIQQGGSTTGTTWGDYDGDGYLDLYVGNYTWSGAPTRNRLYRNLGNRRFQELAGFLGVNDVGCAFQASFVDFDLDADVDLHVVNDRGPSPAYPDNRLWANVSGTFLDITDSSGAGLSMFSMGLTTGDFDRNGWPDFYISNILPNRLLMNNGNGTFTESAAVYGVETMSVSWGVMFFDMDNDGWLDLWVCNTPLEGVGSPAPRLFDFNGTAPAVDVAQSMGLDMLNSSYGVTSADIDDDGDLDVLVVRPFDPVQLYINHASEEPTPRTWLKVRLIGLPPNLHAVGATVFVDDDLGRQQRAVIVGDGYKSQREMVLHFGTNVSTSVSRVQVLWPDGTTSVVEHVPTNQTLAIVQGEIVVPCDAPPAASEPTPGSGAIDISDAVNLLWSGPEGSAFRLHFGDADPPPFIAELETPAYSVESLQKGRTYYWRVDTVGCSTSIGQVWNFKTVAAPSARVRIESPTTGASHVAQEPFVALAGTAEDDAPIERIEWWSDRGGLGDCRTSDNWTHWYTDPVALQSGDNVITVILTSSDGGLASASLLVKYAPPPPEPPKTHVESPEETPDEISEAGVAPVARPETTSTEENIAVLPVSQCGLGLFQLVASGAVFASWRRGRVKVAGS